VTERRPWNRLRKFAGIVLALAVVMFVVGFMTDQAVLKVLAPALLIASAVINLFSVPAQGGEPIESPRRLS
jgi:hypothetical protein